MKMTWIQNPSGICCILLNVHYIVFQPLDVTPRPQEAGPPSERSEDVLASRPGDDFLEVCLYLTASIILDK